MNLSQKCVLLIGGVLFSLRCLFPARWPNEHIDIATTILHLVGIAGFVGVVFVILKNVQISKWFTVNRLQKLEEHREEQPKRCPERLIEKHPSLTLVKRGSKKLGQGIEKHPWQTLIYIYLAVQYLPKLIRYLSDNLAK
jgi:hypothetical protein